MLVLKGMTAEVAILNKEAVTLSADSAVTVNSAQGQKIFTSAYKIFNLSENHSVGIMIYGSASLLGIPMETIIKMYAQNLSSTPHQNLDKYADDFLSFIEKNRTIFPEKTQEAWTKNIIYRCYDLCRRQAQKHVQEKLNNIDSANQEEYRKLFDEGINKEYERWKNAPRTYGMKGVKMEKFENDNKDIIEEAKKEIFQEYPLSSSLSRKLSKIGVWWFFKEPQGIKNSNDIGIVLTGFGSQDIFPKLRSYRLKNIAKNRLQYVKEEGQCEDITLEQTAVIIPFAQKEMVHRFIEGVDDSYEQAIENTLEDYFKQHLPQKITTKLGLKKGQKDQISEQCENDFKDIEKALAEYRQNQFISPITNVVSFLPKDELATMAETLVTLTSFKRRVSMESETVGGPADVATISKGDGFEWIRKKTNHVKSNV